MIDLSVFITVLSAFSFLVVNIFLPYIYIYIYMGFPGTHCLGHFCNLFSNIVLFVISNKQSI